MKKKEGNLWTWRKKDGCFKMRKIDFLSLFDSFKPHIKQNGRGEFKHSE